MSENYGYNPAEFEQFKVKKAIETAYQTEETQTKAVFAKDEHDEVIKDESGAITYEQKIFTKKDDLKTAKAHFKDSIYEQIDADQDLKQLDEEIAFLEIPKIIPPKEKLLKIKKQVLNQYELVNKSFFSLDRERSRQASQEQKNEKLGQDLSSEFAQLNQSYLALRNKIIVLEDMLTRLDAVQEKHPNIFIPTIATENTTSDTSASIVSKEELNTLLEDQAKPAGEESSFSVELHEKEPKSNQEVEVSPISENVETITPTEETTTSKEKINILAEYEADGQLEKIVEKYGKAGIDYYIKHLRNELSHLKEEKNSNYDKITNLLNEFRREKEQLSEEEKNIEYETVTELFDEFYYSGVKSAEKKPIKRRLNFFKDKVLQYENEAAKKEALSLIDIMYDMMLCGFYHNNTVDIAKGLNKKNNSVPVYAEIFSSEGESGEVHNSFNRHSLFNTDGEHFDYISQGDKENNQSKIQTGALQELIAFIYQHYINSYDKSNEYRAVNLCSGIKTVAAMINQVMGENKEDFIKIFQNQKLFAEKFKDVIHSSQDLNKSNQMREKIFNGLKDHDEQMFDFFKNILKFKIARDDLSSLAAFDFAANLDESLPDGVKPSSFGRIATGMRDLSAQGSIGNGHLVLAATSHDLTSVFNETKAAKDKEKKENGTLEAFVKGKFSLIDKYRRRLEVDSPNHNKITSWYRYKQANWHESGIPPSSKALNSADSLNVWSRADDAMQTMQKHAVMTLCPDAPTAIREMNTLGSIINAYTMNLREKHEENISEAELYQDFKKPGSSKYYSYVDKEFLALYMNAITNYILKEQEDRVQMAGHNNINEAEGHHKFIMTQITHGVGSDSESNALNKKIYLPIVERYLKENYEKFLQPISYIKDVLSPQEERNKLYWETYIKKVYPDEYREVDLLTDGWFKQLFLGGITAYDRKTYIAQKEPPKIVGHLNPNNPWKNPGKE